MSSTVNTRVGGVIGWLEAGDPPCGPPVPALERLGGGGGGGRGEPVPTRPTPDPAPTPSVTYEGPDVGSGEMLRDLMLGGGGGAGFRLAGGESAGLP